MIWHWLKDSRIVSFSYQPFEFQIVPQVAKTSRCWGNLLIHGTFSVFQRISRRFRHFLGVCEKTTIKPPWFRLQFCVRVRNDLNQVNVEVLAKYSPTFVASQAKTLGALPHQWQDGRNSRPWLLAHAKNTFKYVFAEIKCVPTVGISDRCFHKTLKSYISLSQHD